MRTIYSYLVFLSLALASNPAWAMTYKVQVTQNYPEQSSGSAACTVRDKICHLTLLQNPEAKTPRYIDVTIRFASDSLYVQFMQDRKYLSTSQSWTPDLNLLFDEKGRAEGKVTLYIPHSDENTDSMLIQPVIRLSNMKVADLEISVQPE